MSVISATARPRERAARSIRGLAAAPWLVATCIVATGTSLAAFVYLQFGLALTEAGGIGFVAVMLMLAAEHLARRNRERAAFEARFADLTATTGQLMSEVARIEGRLSEVEAALPRQVDDRLDGRLVAVDTELQDLDARLRDLEETVAGLQRARAPAPAGRLNEAPHEPFESQAAAPEEALETIRAAIEDNRTDVFLQPIVQLPQRRVRYYEALTRLRDEDGRTILPEAYLPVAEPAGLMPLIDNILLFRCVQIVRRMSRRNPDLAIFCNISARSLADARFLPQFIDFMADNQELAHTLIFEFPQAVLEALGPVEQEGLASLADLGFRLSVDHVRHLDIDGPTYAAQRVRFIKMDAGLLLDPPPGGHIHITDQASLLARSGIDVVASQVETEAQLVDLLDYDIHLGQGHLFSPPRPVRSEILSDAGQNAPWPKP